MSIEFIDRSISACLPDKIQFPELHSLVKTYQTHSHSKTCKKYRNVPCRFNFGHFFTKKTIITKPLSQELHKNLRAAKLKEREDILSKVKVFIDEVLNPAKAEKYKPDLTIEQILDSLDITEEQYYEALSISVSNDHEIHLKRSPDSCFINNYSPTVLTAWQANIDIQPVFDYYKCVTYLCSYMSKGETECSEAIKAAASEALKDNLEIKETLKKIGAAFLCSREVSSQECVYRCLPELWLRKTFPQTVFINTDFPDKRVRMKKSDKQIVELDEDSTDIYCCNIIDRYTDRPNTTFHNGAYAVVDNICLAQFAAYYYKDYKQTEEVNDSQPVVLQPESFEVQQIDSVNLSTKVRLMTRNETMKRRKVKAVIRYHKPNKTTEPERFFHHLLMLYLPGEMRMSCLDMMEHIIQNLSHQM